MADVMLVQQEDLAAAQLSENVAGIAQDIGADDGKIGPEDMFIDDDDLSEDDDDLPPADQEIKHVIVRTDAALLDIFFGKGNDAVKKLEEIVAPLTKDAPAAPRPDATPKPLSLMTTLRLLAANAMVVCQQYMVSRAPSAGESVDRATLAASIATLHDLVRRYPPALRLTPMVHNLVVLAQMDGDETVNRRLVIETLVEAFVTGKEAFPKVLK